MHAAKSVFSRIIDREIPSDIVYETDLVIVIKNINPVAPIHYLIIPKKPIVTMSESAFDGQLAAEFVKTVQHLASQLPGDKSYNIICNNGASAGQSVFHVHWHFISGKNLYEDGFSL